MSSVDWRLQRDGNPGVAMKHPSLEAGWWQQASTEEMRLSE